MTKEVEEVRLPSLSASCLVKPLGNSSFLGDEKDSFVDARRVHKHACNSLQNAD